MVCVRSLPSWLALLCVACPGAVGVQGAERQHLASRPIRSSASLLQLRNGVSPFVLGDLDQDEASLAVDKLDHEAAAPGRLALATMQVGAVDSAAMVPPKPGSQLKLLAAKEQIDKEAEVPVAVRFDRTVDAVSGVAALLAAGAKAAAKNAGAETAAAWIKDVAEDARLGVQQALAPAAEQPVAVAAPGARLLSTAARRSPEELASLRESQRRPVAMVSVAATAKAQATAATSADRADVPAARLARLTVAQRQQLETSQEQLRAEREVEVQRTAELERQFQMEDVMSETRELHRWA